MCYVSEGVVLPEDPPAIDISKMSYQERRTIMFGVPKIVPKIIPIYLFQWHQSQLCTAGPPRDQTLVPHHRDRDPGDGWFYPYSQSYSLNPVPDSRFRRQYFYCSDYKAISAPQLLERLIGITTHPATSRVDFSSGTAVP